MKRSLSFAIAVMMLFMMIAASTAAIADGYYAVYSHCKNGKALNVRSGPGKEYDVLYKVPYGEAIYVIGETTPGWLQLNDVGYVQAALTSRTYPGPYVEPTNTPAPGSGSETGKTESLDSVFATAKQVEPYLVTLKGTPKSRSVANVRWAPSKTSRLQKAYPAGTQVKVIAELDKWYQIQDPLTNMVGFVNIAYVEQ